MNIRQILLALSGKDVTLKEIEDLQKKSTEDKPVNAKLCKVVKIAKANKLTRFKFVVSGAFKTLLTGKKQTKGKVVPFHQKEISGLDGIDTFTQKEAAELGIIDGLGKLNHKDVYKDVNKKILSFLKDDKLKWRKPWREGVKIKGSTYGPQNYVTQAPYRGGNAFYIWICNLFDGTNYNYFLTKKQIADRGGKLKENATRFIVSAYIKKTETNTATDKEGNTAEYETILMQGRVFYHVYPIEHTIGVKPIKRKEISEDKKDITDFIIAPETIIEKMTKKPSIKIGGSDAYYSPVADYVQMPPKKAFEDINKYYSVLFHELIHSTGNEKRIGRDLKGKFGSKSYAFEELIAELGAAYLCGISNIEYYTLKNSAAYLKNWASKLRSEMVQDETFFFRAVLSATRAAKYIVGETILTDNAKNNVKPNDKPNVNNAKKVKTESAQLPLLGKGLSGTLSGTMSVTDVLNGKFELLGLDGQWLKMIGEACKPTSFFIYGPGGSGKSTFTLKFAYYLAQKGNKVAYIAGEQFNTPVLQKMLQRLNIKELPNFTIVQNFEAINVEDFEILALDSKDSLDVDHDNFLELKEKYPKQTWCILSEGTKAGSWKGSETWRNRTDCLIYCENGVAYTGLDKNRWGGKGEMKVY